MDDLADTAVPVADPRAESVTVDGDLVVVAGGRVHRLSPSAAEILRGCDGRTPVGELAATLADRFGVARAVMARDVRVALRQLVDGGLVRPVDGPDDHARPRLEPAPVCSSCGPGPAYARHVLIDLGTHEASIGCDALLAPALRAAFGRRAVGVDERPVGRPSYGLVLDRAPTGPVRALHRLHRGPDVVVAHRDPERPLRALVTLLSRHTRPGGGYLDALAVGDGERVALVRPPVRVAALDREAASAGLTLDEGVSVQVVADRAVRLGPHPDDDIDWERVRRAVPGPVGLRPVGAPLAWGTVAVTDIVVHGTPDRVSAFCELGPLMVDAPGPVEPLRSFLDTVPIAGGGDRAVIGVLARRGVTRGSRR